MAPVMAARTAARSDSCCVRREDGKLADSRPAVAASSDGAACSAGHGSFRKKQESEVAGSASDAAFPAQGCANGSTAGFRNVALEHLPVSRTSVSQWAHRAWAR